MDVEADVDVEVFASVTTVALDVSPEVVDAVVVVVPSVTVELLVELEPTVDVEVPTTSAHSSTIQYVWYVSSSSS